MVHAEAFSEAGDLAGHMVHGHGRDDRRGSAQRADPSLRVAGPPAPLAQFCVYHQVGERLGAGQRGDEGGGPVPGQHLGRVASRWQDGCCGPAGGGGEEMVGTDSRVPPGLVRVERGHRPGPGQVRHLAERGDLTGGQRGAAGRQASEPPGAGDGHRDGVERAFDEHGQRAPGQQLTGFPQSEQRGALVIQAGPRAVDVFGHIRPSGGGGAADEGGHPAFG